MKHIAALLLLCSASAALAHKDRLLSVSASGAVPELPSRYATTRLHVEFSQGTSGRLTKLQLQSTGRTTTIKDCALRLVQVGSKERLRLSGSWYHDKKYLPDYVQVRFNTGTAIESDLDAQPAVLFLFSLQDARLLEVQEVVPLPQQQGVQYRDVKLKEGCPNE